MTTEGWHEKVFWGNEAVQCPMWSFHDSIHALKLIERYTANESNLWYMNIEIIK